MNLHHRHLCHHRVRYFPFLRSRNQSICINQCSIVHYFDTHTNLVGIYFSFCKYKLYIPKVDQVLKRKFNELLICFPILVSLRFSSLYFSTAVSNTIVINQNCFSAWTLFLILLEEPSLDISIQFLSYSLILGKKDSNLGLKLSIVSQDHHCHLFSTHALQEAVHLGDNEKLFSTQK